MLLTFTEVNSLTKNVKMTTACHILSQDCDLSTRSIREAGEKKHSHIKDTKMLASFSRVPIVDEKSQV